VTSKPVLFAVVLAFATSKACLQAQTPAPAPDLSANPPPRLTALNPNLPTIFIAGDSTAARSGATNQQGWGVPFAEYFDTTKVNIANRARGGRSSRTFINEGLWDQLLTDVKSNDIVLIQFGQNDGGPVNDATRARGSLRGLGEETEEIDNLMTKKHEVVHTYGWYMRKMIADTKAKGAKPVVLSLIVRNIWKDGRVERGSGRYSQWAAEVAKTERVRFVDVANPAADKFEELGEEKMKAMYPRDHTHFNIEGARIHAELIVAGLKGQKPGIVNDFLSKKGEEVVADEYAWLNLPRPNNVALPSLFLIGDSTVRNGRGNGSDGQWGWGDYVGPFFDTDKINVVNRAVGGLSSRTYLTQRHWDRVMAMMKKGDFVMIQFGHNDGGAVNDNSRARGSIQGIGEEVREINNDLTKQNETVHTYGWYLRKYIADARSKGATPIVCSPVPRKIWQDGKILQGKNSYSDWSEQVAKAEGAAFLDLNEIIAFRYDELGSNKVETLFADARTHTSKAGAEVNAACVVSGLKTLIKNPLAAFLRVEKP
jgi:lysophospholipase L1-like esterase